MVSKARRMSAARLAPAAETVAAANNQLLLRTVAKQKQVTIFVCQQTNKVFMLKSPMAGSCQTESCFAPHTVMIISRAVTLSLNLSEPRPLSWLVSGSV